MRHTDYDVERFNHHHILFDRTQWESSELSLKLRDKSSLLVFMDIDEHRELHAHCPSVPLMSHYIQDMTLRELKSSSDPIIALSNLELAIERAQHRQQANDLEKRLADLTLEAIELQKPFIQTSPDHVKRVIIP